MRQLVPGEGISRLPSIERERVPGAGLIIVAFASLLLWMAVAAIIALG